MTAKVLHMQLCWTAVKYHLMDGVGRDCDKVFGNSRRVCLLMNSLGHIISVYECCVSSRAVDVCAKLRKRPHDHIRVWNDSKSK